MGLLQMFDFLKNDIAVKDSLHPSVQYNIIHICHYLKKKSHKNWIGKQNKTFLPTYNGDFYLYKCIRVQIQEVYLSPAKEN